MIPTPRSKTKRRDLAQDARRNLDVYRGYAEADTTNGRVLSFLLSAQAAIERALHAETGGRVGNPNADWQTVMADYRAKGTYAA